MDDRHLLPKDIAAFGAELSRQLAQEFTRVGVNFQEAFPQLQVVAAPQPQRISDTEIELVRTVDISGIIGTLRQLPPGAGTAAFVSAYNAEERVLDLDAPAS